MSPLRRKMARSRGLLRSMARFPRRRRKCAAGACCGGWRALRKGEGGERKEILRFGKELRKHDGERRSGRSCGGWRRWGLAAAEDKVVSAAAKRALARSLRGLLRRRTLSAHLGLATPVACDGGNWREAQHLRLHGPQSASSPGDAGCIIWRQLAASTTSSRTPERV